MVKKYGNPKFKFQAFTGPLWTHAKGNRASNWHLLLKDFLFRTRTRTTYGGGVSVAGICDELLRRRNQEMFQERHQKYLRTRATIKKENLNRLWANSLSSIDKKVFLNGRCSPWVCIYEAIAAIILGNLLIYFVK